jgi:hypothetical protein
MVATAVNLTEYVLPPLSICQWVLAMPKRLRHFLLPTCTFIVSSSTACSSPRRLTV